MNEQDIKSQSYKLPQGDVISNLPFIQFAEDNEYRFLMDFGSWKNVPSNIKFYPLHETNNGLITFIGDGYGIMGEHKEKFGLAGQYGSGSISVFVEDIPHIVNWCRKNFIHNATKI